MAAKPKNTKNKKGAAVSFQSEVALLLILAVCIIWFISHFGIGGFVGEKISSLSFGLFGMMSYLVPVCFFVGAAFFISNRDNGIAIIKLVAGALFVSFLCLFVELVVGSQGSYSVKDSFAYAVEHKNGGGALGGLLAFLLCPAIGKAGAYVLDVIVLIISLVLLTERSFLGGLKKGSRKVYDTAREDAVRRKGEREMRREEREDRQELRELRQSEKEERKREREMRRAEKEDRQEQRESRRRGQKLQKKEQEQRDGEQEQRRMDRKVEGVVLDTKIYPVSRKRSDNISELKLPEEGLGAKQRGAALGSQSSGTGGQSVFAEPIVVEKVHRKPISMPRVSGASEGEFAMPEAAMANGTEFAMPEAVMEEEAPFAVPEVAVTEEAPFAIPEAAMANGTEFAVPAAPVAEEAHLPRSGAAMASGRNTSEPEMEAGENLPEVEEELLQTESTLADAAKEMLAAPGSGQGSAAMGADYMFPPISLLKPGDSVQGDSRQHLQETAIQLQQILKNFGVKVTISNVSCGPTVTRYELQPELGVKVSKIVNLADDIKLNLAAADIRIEAPIPGKAAVGIEVPNKKNVMVRFRELVEAEEFQNHKSSICFTAGKDIGGQVIVADIAKMPHLLIAGATGSGKSVCINTIIMSILYKANPEDVKLILIDPKVVELSVYNGIPHLFIPVVTDPKKAAGALHWAVAEMTDRYQKFADYQVRDLKGYNQKVEAIKDVDDEMKPKKLPQIVIIVDELADLMMVAPGDVEDAICRLAQLARAAGIHLIIATQRPSVDVITGLIKANMPSRIAFSVSSGVDSRTILDMVGAEKLLGNGDMLFYPQGYQKPLRVQGPFVSDTEVEEVVDFLKKQSSVVYNTEIEEKMNTVSIAGGGSGGGGNEKDAYFIEAGKFVIEKEKGSIGMLQRMFKIGFNRAARIMDQLQEAGVVGPEEGTKPRKILMSMAEFEEYNQNNEN